MKISELNNFQFVEQLEKLEFVGWNELWNIKEPKLQGYKGL